MKTALILLMIVSAAQAVEPCDRLTKQWDDSAKQMAMHKLGPPPFRTTPGIVAAKQMAENTEATRQGSLIILMAQAKCDAPDLDRYLGYKKEAYSCTMWLGVDPQHPEAKKACDRDSWAYKEPNP